MKSIHALILALGLGIAGALFNWAYLANKTRDVQTVEYIGVAPGATLAQGDLLQEKNLVAVPVPEGAAGNLDDFAIRYREIKTVLDRPVWRTLTEGRLLLRDDLETPPQRLRLGEDPVVGENERAMWIPVDTRTFVPSLVEPGQFVSFLLPRSPAGLGGGRSIVAPPESSADEPSDEPEADEPGGPSPTPATAPGGDTEIIGPFKILSLGNRLGSADVMRAARVPQVQENVMTISVRVENDRLEPRAEKLWQWLRSTNFREVGILLHPPRK